MDFIDSPLYPQAKNIHSSPLYSGIIRAMSQKDIKCIGCYEKHTCRDSGWAWFFLFIGILASVAMRAVVIFMHVNPAYANAAWYVGVGFFFVFFMYKFNISRTMSKIIIENGLIKKLKEDGDLDREDREVLGTILCGIVSSKERINFLVIFVLSGIALIAAVVMDILK
ncbi:MAG: hypothetical protein ABH862_01370 [Candidatus Omnitrophota bacterium]